jgi:hypothetical protein
MVCKQRHGVIFLVGGITPRVVVIVVIVMLEDCVLWGRKVVIVVVTESLAGQEALVYITLVGSGWIGLALVTDIEWPWLSTKILSQSTRRRRWWRENGVATQKSSHHPPNGDSESGTCGTKPPEFVEPCRIDHSVAVSGRTDPDAPNFIRKANLSCASTSLIFSCGRNR